MLKYFPPCCLPFTLTNSTRLLKNAAEICPSWASKANETKEKRRGAFLPAPPQLSPTHLSQLKNAIRRFAYVHENSQHIYDVLDEGMSPVTLRFYFTTVLTDDELEVFADHPTRESLVDPDDSANDDVESDLAELSSDGGICATSASTPSVHASSPSASPNRTPSPIPFAYSAKRLSLGKKPTPFNGSILKTPSSSASSRKSGTWSPSGRHRPAVRFPGLPDESPVKTPTSSTTAKKSQTKVDSKDGRKSVARTRATLQRTRPKEKHTSKQGEDRSKEKRTSK
jgi:hypothetical protein